MSPFGDDMDPDVKVFFWLSFILMIATLGIPIAFALAVWA